MAGPAQLPFLLIVAAGVQQMTWREGVETPLAIPPGRFSQVRLSPDGRRLAVRACENGWHIVVYDVDRPTGTKLTTAARSRGGPKWQCRHQAGVS
jgi:hypothetical protein